MMRTSTHIYLGICLLIISSLLCARSGAEGLKYESKGRRDPLVPLIGAESVAAGSLENVTTIKDITLGGIAMGSSGKNVAILNGEIVKEKDKLGILEIIKITKTEVRVAIDGAEYAIGLSEEGGAKGGK